MGMKMDLPIPELLMYRSYKLANQLSIHNSYKKAN